MAIATISPSQPLSSILFATPARPSSYPRNVTLTLPSSSISPPPTRELRRTRRKKSDLWRASAANGDALPLDTQLEKAQDVVSSAGDDITSTIISGLLFTAFIGLSILTIGVIYLGVTDFLQKREREKFEKEDAANKKKSGKRAKVKARAGPKGFGQKLVKEEEEED